MEGGRIVQSGTAQDIVLRPADAYVAEFVRHMNPLEALRASSVMRPLDEMPRDGDVVLACTMSRLRVTLQRDNRIMTSTIGEPATPGTIAPHGTLNGQSVGAAAVTVPGDLPLKQAIALRHAQNCSLLVVDPTGALIGSIGEGEIFRALLRT